MASVAPITCADLNGVEFNTGELVIDDVVGYVDYARNLCTDLGTPNDTKEGYNDYLEFQQEIESAHITTFEPDAADETHTFEAVDLSGSNEPITRYPFMVYSAPFGNSVFFSYSKPVTPFDLPEKGDCIPDRLVTPFDFPDFNTYLAGKNNDDIDLN